MDTICGHGNEIASCPKCNPMEALAKRFDVEARREEDMRDAGPRDNYHTHDAAAETWRLAARMARGEE